MVRRWSYLNNINSNLFYSKTSHIGSNINALNLITFKTTTYYWEELFYYCKTFLKRRSYHRRKHINSLVLYQNLLSSWSVSYLFFRRYCRSLLNINLSRYTYLTQSIFIAKGLDISSLIGFEGLKMTFFTKKTLSYLFNFGPKILTFFLTYSGPALYTSSYELLFGGQTQNISLKEEPYYPILENSIIHFKQRKDALKILDSFVLSLKSLFLIKITNLYKIFILTDRKSVV